MSRCLSRIALGALLVSGCTRPRTEPAQNVLVIVIDTLGAEHLGAYGGPTRSPSIDRLAREGVLFERAFSTAPWTKPSIASLFTGVMPSRHGVRRLTDRLNESVATLAEHAQACGFETHAVISHFLITTEHGYGQGFDTFDGSAIAGHEGISSRKVTDQALAFLERRTDERFFLFVHYFDPHFAYHQHKRFAHTGDYEGPVASGMEIWSLRDLRGELAQADVEHLRDLYREEIAFTDFHVGRLLDALAEHGLAEDTLVVFTADHGEELMEHGWIGHTRTLYDELLRVPLIISLPSRIEPRVVPEPVSLLDVAPTIAQLAGLPRLPGWEGTSLAPLLCEGKGVHLNRPVFAEVSFGNADPGAEARNPRAADKVAHKTAVIVNDLKLIHDEPSDSYELFDRRSDGEERKNLWQAGFQSSHPLAQRLRAWEKARAEGSLGDAAVFDEAQLEELRRLGYVR